MMCEDPNGDSFDLLCDFNKNQTSKINEGPEPGFEPGTEDPQSHMLPSYTTRAILLWGAIPEEIFKVYASKFLLWVWSTHSSTYSPAKNVHKACLHYSFSCK